MTSGTVIFPTCDKITLLLHKPLVEVRYRHCCALGNGGRECFQDTPAKWMRQSRERWLGARGHSSSSLLISGHPFSLMKLNQKPVGKKSEIRSFWTSSPHNTKAGMER